MHVDLTGRNGGKKERLLRKVEDGRESMRDAVSDANRTAASDFVAVGSSDS